jgi:hypothetical protein
MNNGEMMGKPGLQRKEREERDFNCDEEDEDSYVNTCVYFT